jgi:hypothetical protein
MEETVSTEALAAVSAEEAASASTPPDATSTANYDADKVQEVDETEIKRVIREFLGIDNRFSDLKDEMRDLRSERKRFIATIAAFMVKRSLVKIPIKPNDEECLQLTTVKKTKKPTKDEMVELLVKIMSDGDGVLDKSAPEIVETLVAPTSVQHIYDVRRKRKRASRSEAKRQQSSADSKADEPKLRDLLAMRGRSSSSPPPLDREGGDGDEEGDDPTSGGVEPAAKRRRAQQ